MIRRFAVLFLLTFLLVATSCKRSDVAGNENSVAANRADEETLATPPFPTKEPERYQALRVITASIDGKAADDEAELGALKKTFIARDGARRREDYEATGISFLQLPSGTYVLMPEKKLYAEWKSETNGVVNGKTANVPPIISPDKLLNETRPEAHYEKLGTETVNGRMTVKYRITLKGKAGDAKETTTENFIWVDESLGMPIKSEMASTGGARFTMELRDIKETVDAGTFDLPQDYRKVEVTEIFARSKLMDAATKGRE